MQSAAPVKLYVAEGDPCCPNNAWMTLWPEALMENVNRHSPTSVHPLGPLNNTYPHSFAVSGSEDEIAVVITIADRAAGVGDARDRDFELRRLAGIAGVTTAWADWTCHLTPRVMLSVLFVAGREGFITNPC
jgi:hypothetical protein